MSSKLGYTIAYFRQKENVRFNYFLGVLQALSVFLHLIVFFTFLPLASEANNSLIISDLGDDIQTGCGVIVLMEIVMVAFLVFMTCFAAGCSPYFLER